MPPRFSRRYPNDCAAPDSGVGRQPAIVSQRRSALPICALGYTLGLSAWFGLRLLIFDGRWWLAILNTIALMLFVPLPLLAAAILARRRWRLLPILLIPALLFAQIYGARFLPRSRPTIPEPSHMLTVMTLNVLYRNRDTAALRAAIMDVQPHVLGVQEATPAQARWLADALASEYPYRAFRVGPGESGTALLSRYPISSVEQIAEPPRRLGLRAVLDVAGTPLHVVVVHLSPNRSLRTPPPNTPDAARRYYALKSREVERVIAMARGDAPSLVLCDCNLTETSQAYAQLAASFRDSFHEAGRGLGLTSQLLDVPVLVQRIDYIWHAPEIVVDAAWVGPNGGSDHRSVIARLAIPASGR